MPCSLILTDVSFPANESLSAYGLLEFVDMAKVYPVEAQLVPRCRAWLLSRRDGSGAFKRDSKALDSFGSVFASLRLSALPYHSILCSHLCSAAPPEITNAYIVYALTESDPQIKTELQKEIDCAYLSFPSSPLSASDYSTNC